MLNNIKKVFVLFVILCNSFSYNSENSSAKSFRIKFFSVKKLQKLGLFFDDSGFHIDRGNEIIDIPTYNLDPELRKISLKNLKLLLNNGYIHLKQIADDEFILRANIKGLGGGPITGYILASLGAIICGTFTTVAVQDLTEENSYERNLAKGGTFIRNAAAGKLIASNCTAAVSRTIANRLDHETRQFCTDTTVASLAIIPGGLFAGGATISAGLGFIGLCIPLP